MLSQSMSGNATSSFRGAMPIDTLNSSYGMLFGVTEIVFKPLFAESAM